MKLWITPSVILAVALLAGSELIARKFFARSLSGRFEYGFHPTAGFQENDDGTVNLLNVGGRPFRAQSFSFAPSNHTFRVMVFGHSVPYGYYGNAEAPIEEAYPALIAIQLRELGIRAEGINLCIGGYGAQRINIVLRQALRYRPNLVVLHVHPWSNDELNDRRRKEFAGWHPKNWSMKPLVVRRLYEAKNQRLAVKWLPEELRLAPAAGQSVAKLEAPTPADEQRWTEQTLSWTRENIRLARQQGVSVIIVSKATKSASAPGSFTLDEQGLDRRLEPMTGEGVYFISMKRLFEKQRWPELFTDHVHLNRQGHDLIAREIVRIVRENRLIESSNAPVVNR